MSTIKQFNLRAGQRAERKTLITVAEWTEYTLLDSAPDDWATTYEDYFTRTATTNGGYLYEKIGEQKTTPTFATDTYYSSEQVREILGTRTEDSSIEYNADIETMTDIRGINYTDIKRTQPQQDFDPYLVLGGSRLGAFLNEIRRRNAVSELNQFTIYVITAFIGTEGSYEAEKQVDCTITYNSMGGDANVNFPISVYMSNIITTGTVDKLSSDFVFTADATV